MHAKRSILCFRPEVPFSGNFGPENQNCQFKPKFGTKNNPTMYNSMVMFTFSALDQKYQFRYPIDLVPKNKIVCLK